MIVYQSLTEREYGPADGIGSSRTVIGVPTGTRVKNGIARIWVRSGTGRVRRSVTVSPATSTPVMSFALWFTYASAPSSSGRKRNAAGSPILGENARSREYRTVSAVTAAPDGGENRKPGRTRICTVRPSGETTGAPAATSGTGAPPAAPAVSG